MKNVLITAYKNNGQQHLNSAYVDTFSKPGHCVTMTPVIDKVICKENPLYIEERLQELADNLADKNDILVISGGRDINPIVYGEINVASTNTDINRDMWELCLFNSFRNKNKPIMGICRGFQLIGTQIGIPNFYQDIGKIPESHNASDFGVDKRTEVVHNTKIVGSLANFFVEKKIKGFTGLLQTNSFHHQGFVITGGKENRINNEILDFKKKCSNIGVEIVAHTVCILEGFLHKNIFGVQWHPEEYENSNIINFFLEKVC